MFSDSQYDACTIRMKDSIPAKAIRSIKRPLNQRSGKLSL
jgi:hypothetical protein